MAALIEFYAGAGASINNLAGSGLGFYGDNGFGYSVPVGSYNGHTYITDSTGTSQGPEADNCKYLNTSGVILGQESAGIHLLRVPNYQATLNIRFTNGTAVKTQNAKLYISDRTNKNNDPSGVVCYTASIVHPNLTQDNTGSGSAVWVNTHGSGSVLNLPNSPGVSGLSPAGSATSSTTHDFFALISCSPSTVGSKEFMSTVELEFL